MSNIIGIDVSKATLHCAWLRDPDQEKAKRRSCQNDERCFESLITWSEAVSKLPRGSLAFVVEPTHVYHEQLVQFLHRKGTTVYLVNPGRVRKFAEGTGILSKNDVIDADLLTRSGLTARKLVAYESAPQEVNDLRSLMNRLNVLERNLGRELNRLEKAGKSLTFHRLEHQSITLSIKRHEAETVAFKSAARECECITFVAAGR